MLASEPVGPEILRDALGEEQANDAQVLVVSPALQGSKLKFLTGDSDDAIARAEEVQEESVERLGEEGIDAAGDTGESDPLLAVKDALATFEADRIVVFSHPEGHGAVLEDEGIARLEQETGLPVERRETAD